MGFLDRLRGKPEIRAETAETITPGVDADLLRALIGKDTVTKELALQIPTVQACINLIANTISKLPIVLYQKDAGGDIREIKDDRRVKLLNSDIGDTLTAKQFWRAIIEDYFLGKGGFAYIQRYGKRINKIFFVDEKNIFVIPDSFDPIFKSYTLNVQGRAYFPQEFIKFLRKTHDGMRSFSVIDESPLVLSVAYNQLQFEYYQTKKGGMKRGYLQTEKPITEKALESLKVAFRHLYGESDENVVVLNNGTTFKEASATPAELQLNESKASISEEVCKLFGVPASLISGSKTGNSMTEFDIEQFIKTCVAIMTDIECSLNRDFLEPEEKDSLYWSFDTKELTRGSIKERYDAYRIGLDKNFLQIDEVRKKEGLEPLGIDWLQLNLNTVLYDINNKLIYTPNTNQWTNLGEGTKLSSGEEGGEDDESGAES